MTEQPQGLQTRDAPGTLGDRILGAHAAEARARLASAGVITHPGELGRAREQTLRRFLREIAPRGFDVETGFVIDSHGNQSRQQDLVFVRRDYHPVFRSGSARFFPIEAIAAVVEVKSKLRSDTLADALRNSASVKRLDRTGGGGNYRVLGGFGGAPAGEVDPERHDHQVFSVIVAAEAVAVDTLIPVIQEHLAREPRRAWPNMIAVAGAWSLTYQPPDLGTGIRSDQMNGVALRVSEARDPRNVDPLADVAEQLWSFLRVSPLIDVRPSRYITGSWWPNAIFPLSAESTVNRGEGEAPEPSGA